MTTRPDEADVRQISAMVDGAARNALITNSYFQLSQVLRERLPGAASWCTFATWASRQAGITIREQDLTDLLRQRLRDSQNLRGPLGRLRTEVDRAELELLELTLASVSDLGPLKRSSEAVARGNQKVYAEIGLEFARFLTAFPELASATDADLDSFIEGLRSGDPPNGQGLLQAAFRNYRSAARALTSKERAEWMLLANLQIGFHEQTRLQPDILGAMNAAVLDPGDLTDLLLDRIGARTRRRLRRFFRLLPFFETPLRRHARRVAEEVRAVVREVATEHLMRLSLAREVVWLGRDLDRPFPAELQDPVNPQLANLLKEVAPPSSAAGSAARDWANLHQRMRFIADLFRTYQQDEDLFAPP